MARPNPEQLLREEFLNGRLSRRGVMKHAAALGLSAPVIMSSVRTTGAVTRPAGSVAQQGKPGGELVISFPSAPLRIDPALAGSAGEYMITQAIYNNLIRVDAELMLQPELAKSWELDADGVTYTFTLEQGVKFHHGKEMTSTYVAYTINRIRDEATASSGRSLFAVVDSIETPDEYTVVFKLSSSYADFPFALASTFGRILPSDVPVADLTSKPVGTGPFKMQSYEPGSQVVMVKNENYWQEGLPYLDRVTQVQIPEPTGQAAALSAGQTHIFWDVAPQTVSTVMSDPNVTVVEIPSPSFQPIGMRCNTPPFDKVEVRQALKYTLDREGILQAVVLGHGTVSNDHQVSPVSPFWVDTGVKKRDIAKAKELLAKGGYPNGIDIELIASNERPGLVEQATILKELAAEAGFRIGIKVVPWDVFVAEYNDTAPFFATNWFGRPSIDETLYPYLHSTGSWNEYNYSNPEVDRLLEAGRTETDIEKRKPIYAQVQQIVSEDGPVVVAYHKTYITAYRNQVKGYTAHPIRWVDLRETWLES